MTQAVPQESPNKARPVERRRKTERIGAVVIGGDHPGLAIARSLGKRGIPVYVIEDQHSISAHSKYPKRVVRVDDLRDPRKTVDAVLQVGEKYGLRDWVLFPTRDETVMAISQQRDRVDEFFRVTTPPWESTRSAWDKNNTYKLAEELGIPAPRTWNVQPKNSRGFMIACRWPSSPQSKRIFSTPLVRKPGARTRLNNCSSYSTMPRNKFPAAKS